MSKHCRQDRTAIVSVLDKLLILKGRATVSEGRQRGQLVASPNNIAEQGKAHVLSHCGFETTNFLARFLTLGTESQSDRRTHCEIEKIPICWCLSCF